MLPLGQKREKALEVDQTTATSNLEIFHNVTFHRRLCTVTVLITSRFLLFGRKDLFAVPFSLQSQPPQLDLVLFIEWIRPTSTCQSYRSTILLALISLG